MVDLIIAIIEILGLENPYIGVSVLALVVVVVLNEVVAKTNTFRENRRQAITEREMFLTQQTNSLIEDYAERLNYADQRNRDLQERNRNCFENLARSEENQRKMAMSLAELSSQLQLSKTKQGGGGNDFMEEKEKEGRRSREI